jgi:YopT peptidase
VGLQSFIIKQYIRYMQTLAEKHHGQCTAKFSQALEPVNSMIGKHAVSRDGICQAMSQKWIVLHAHGSSLFNWVYQDDGTIDAAAISNLSINQIETETRLKGQSGKTDQDWASEKYLFSHGIMRRSGIIPQVNSGYVQSVRSLISGDKSTGDIFGQLANALVNSSKLITGYYMMIGIQGSGGGHCMAAYVGEDICFFDPNFGEFWFPKRQDFVGWFRGAIPLPYRVGRINKTFSVREYAPKMGFVKRGDEVGGHAMIGPF